MFLTQKLSLPSLIFKGISQGNCISLWSIEKCETGWKYVGIYCQLINDLIESTRAQIFSRQIQNGDT